MTIHIVLLQDNLNLTFYITHVTYGDVGTSLRKTDGIHMTIQQYWTVELDQGNVVVDKRWVIILRMLNDFGRVADLFCAVPVSRADAIVGDVQFVTYTVRSCEGQSGLIRDPPQKNFESSSPRYRPTCQGHNP